MQFFFTDETNITKDKKLEFFLFGGVIVDAKELKNFITEFNKIKQLYGIDINIPIKWPNKGLDPKIHANIKNDILELVKNSNCKIIIYLALQDFYHDITFANHKFGSKINPEMQKKAQEYAMNVCMHKFNKYLEKVDDLGLVITDDFEGEMKNHMSKHCSSLYIKGTDFSTLERVVYPTIMIDNEYSPFHQVNDVVLGAIQHSLKELTYNFLPILKDNFWKSDTGDYLGRGVNIYPKTPSAPYIKKSVDDLRDKFERLIAKI